MSNLVPRSSLCCMVELLPAKTSSLQFPCDSTPAMPAVAKNIQKPTWQEAPNIEDFLTFLCPSETASARESLESAQASAAEGRAQVQESAKGLVKDLKAQEQEHRDRLSQQVTGFLTVPLVPRGVFFVPWLNQVVWKGRNFRLRSLRWRLRLWSFLMISEIRREGVLHPEVRCKGQKVGGENCVEANETQFDS